MNYRQVYTRYEQPAYPAQGPSGRKGFGVYKNMQSSGFGSGGDYHLLRYQPFLGQSAGVSTDPNSQFQHRDKPLELPAHSYSQPNTRYIPSIEAKEAGTYDKPHAANLTDSAYQDKLADLQKLQEQLRKHEEELDKYQQLKQSQSPAKASLPPNVETFDRINKALWDKQVFAERRKMTVQALDYQLGEKEMRQHLKTVQQEQEHMQRLEHLKRLREVEKQERLNQLSKAQQYRQHLEVQQQVKEELAVQERIRNKAVPPGETAPPQYPQNLNRSYEPKTEYEKVAMQFYDLSTDSPTAASLTPFRLTKKAPKTISYNPITGIVRDTSIYLQGDIPRPMLRSYLPEPRNQDHIVPVYSHLSAFQQPMYTTKNPLVISTDPISMKLPKRNFRTQEYYEDAAKFFGVEESSGSQLAEYGTMVLQASGQLRRSGNSFKDSRHLVK